MPAAFRPEWLERLRRSVPGADLRFNYVAHRWEFMLPCADGVLRSQFWGRFYVNKADGTREYLKPNEVTGLHDFRDLDDAAMEEACENLEHTFIGNRYDGNGTTRREVITRHRYNTEMRARRYKAAGDLWADMFLDRLPRMRETQQVTVLDEVRKKKQTLRAGDLVNAKGESTSQPRPSVSLVDVHGRALPTTEQPKRRPKRRFA